MNKPIDPQDFTHVMNWLDHSGHATVRWNPGNADEVAIARAQFDDLKTRGFNIFKIEGADRQGSRMETFDPSVREYMVIPQLKGG